MSKKIEAQFSKNAKSYDKYSIIQSYGVEILLNFLPKTLGTILDLGCGSGRVYKQLQKSQKGFDKFYGVDFSKEMLNLHPKNSNIYLKKADFNLPETFEYFKDKKIDTLISASALQWATNLDLTFKQCSKIAPFGAFFIFNSNTFKNLHRCANLKSPIYSQAEVESAFLNHYKPIKIEQYSFNLAFDSVLEMLRYIKKSGVSGGKMSLSYIELKRLIREYPLNYLEFEASVLIGDSLEAKRV